MLAGEEETLTSTHKQKPLLFIGEYPIYLVEDWSKGIGGGLWSTGLALAEYFNTSHAETQLYRHKVQRVLELGSGNGFLAVCLWRACPTLHQIVVTDTAEHLGLMRETISTNGMQNELDTRKIVVQEYLWGSGPLVEMEDNDEKDSISKPFDLIVGSDLAYRDELHDPLIQTILDMSTPGRTVTLLGVTMNDTKPIFFHKLSAAGLQYERLADHLLAPTYRGVNFAIFCIQRQL